MPHWMRVVRGMIGTGLTFAAGIGAATAAVGSAALVFGELNARELLQTVGKFSVVGFIVGVVFSGVLATVARGRSFDRLSFRFVTGLGAGGGFLYFLFIGVANGFRVWSLPTALLNLTLLLSMGGVSAAAMFFIARRAGRALKGGEELRGLGEGGVDTPIAEREAEHVSRL